MNYSLSLTPHAAQVLHEHLLSDPHREQMAITLCGANRLHRELRLLVRDVILLPPDAFCRQTAVALEVKPEVQAFIHQRAHRHGLVQVDWHSHPASAHPAFSAVDDRYEEAQAAYLAHRMDGVPYGSVVVGQEALDARLWIARAREEHRENGQGRILSYRPQAHPICAIHVGGLERLIPSSARRPDPSPAAALSTTFDRQVRAFGEPFQRRLGALRVGVVGVGGLGSALVDHLARLGVHDWVLVDPDVVELTNLNRLVNTTWSDAQKARPKVNVARSTIRQPNPKAHIRALQADVYTPSAQHALKACDLLIAATDNHASRMALNRLAAQYLIPLLHVGFHIGVSGDAMEPTVDDVSGEYAFPEPGRWCLQCAGIIDPQQAGWELAPETQRAMLRQRGYVTDTPAPAVRHLDGVIASLAAAEIHNLVQRYKPLHRYLTYDALRTRLLALQVTPSSDCPVCSPDHGVLGLGDLEPLPDYRRASRVVLPPVELARANRAERPRDETPQVAAPQAAESGETAPHPPAPNRRTRAERLRAALEEPELSWV